MRFKSFVLGSTIALACAMPASAGHFNGWYIGLEGGANWIADNDASFATSFALPSPAPIDFGDGWAVLATTGYGFHNSGWRVEGEFGYRNNDIDAIGGTARTGGELQSMTLMANVLYDFELTERLTFSLGAGAGAAHSTFDDGLLDQDEDTNFAYQGLAGLSYAVSPRLDLTMNYRYLRTDDSDYQGAHLAHTDFYALEESQNHTVTIGLRYDLQPDEAPMVQAPTVAPAPAPPSEPPAAPRQFLVFFGFNKSNLTAEADRVISQAAAAAKQDGAATVVVVGHADTVGSPEYNQKLSERRASVVRDALVGQGIEGTKITASGRGETELLVQTGDGVKEPQNRRATIDLN